VSQQTSSKPSAKTARPGRGAGLRLAILAGILIAVNLLATRFHAGLDLTRERRFTLSPTTAALLRGMTDDAVVDVYLTDEGLPAGFRRLHAATRERLESFRDRSGGRIIFRFVDPFEGKDLAERAQVFEKLARRGIEGLNVRDRGEGGESSEKLVFPYAVVRYRGRETPVNLVEARQGFNPLQTLNYSEGLLEYKFAAAIHKLGQAAPPMVAYLAGHGERFGPQGLDFILSLRQRYTIDTIDLTNTLYIPPIYSAVIIGGPTERFADKEKFKLDQYLMGGGSILLMADAVQASLDSLKGSEVFMATPVDLNLDDQLFRYGLRLNADLIEDADRNLPIPVVVGYAGDRPQIEPRPWTFFPVAEAGSRHPIVANGGGVALRFASSIDTIAQPGITKTILLQSGQYSRVAPAPVRVNLNSMKFGQRRELFNRPYRATAVMVEGEFESLFNNRLPASLLQVLRDSVKRPFAARSTKPGRLVVVGDADVFASAVSPNLGLMELGFWEYDGQQYANKTFLLNTLEYLTDPGAPLEARAKEQTLRLLDKNRIPQERSTWQIVNLAVPLGLLIVFAAAYVFWRKRRYGAAV